MNLKRGMLRLWWVLSSMWMTVAVFMIVATLIEELPDNGWIPIPCDRLPSALRTTGCKQGLLADIHNITYNIFSYLDPTLVYNTAIAFKALVVLVLCAVVPALALGVGGLVGWVVAGFTGQKRT